MTAAEAHNAYLNNAEDYKKSTVKKVNVLKASQMVLR